MTQVRSEAPAF